MPAETNQPHPAKALIVNNPRPLPPTFSPLVLSDFETAVVAQHFHNPQILAGPEATTSKVDEAIPTASLIHFSCHGTVDKAAKHCGILLLAKSQIYTYMHVRAIHNLTARLVVLSACRSGSSAVTIEHVLNLPNAFLAAGAAAVLGTFWHTDELASLLLLTKFYELWVQQRQPVESLGEAQAWLMNGRADAFRAAVPKQVLASPAAYALVNAEPDEYLYRHPWYWAAFFMAGA